MRRIIRRLGIALLTFCAGLAISHLFLIPLPVSQETANSRGALKDHLPHAVPLRNPGSQGCVLLVPEYIRDASLEKIQELSRNVNVLRCVPFCFDE
jgi:hypothetical protein